MHVPSVSLPGPPVAHRVPAGETFGPRRLHNFEFVCILSGSAEVRLDDHTHLLRPGQLQLTRPDMIDHYTWRGPRPSHAYVHFDLLDVGRLPQPNSWPLVVRMPTQGSLQGLLADLHRLRAVGRQTEAAEVTALLLDRFVMGADPHVVGQSTKEPFVNAVIEVLHHAWCGGRMTPMPVPALADQLALSCSQTTRLSRSVFGAPPAELIELLRLHHAANLLLRTNSPICSIAAVCGFSDQFHFAKRFRHVYGTTATAFRGEQGDSVESPLAQRSGALAELGMLVEDF